MIEDAEDRKFLGVASCWEIAIKAGPGKLRLGEPGATDIAAAISRTGFEVLPISMVHATAVERRPSHHRDPFDRLLIAPAMIEGSPVVGVDSQLDAYGVTRLW